MQFQAITAADVLWAQVREYAAACSWRAGAALARDMDALSDWERVIVALEGDTICGYCTVTKTDCIPDVPYTPYVGFVFVGEEHRGHRLSQQMIEYAIAYLRSVGFDRVYLTSDHENLYEKYGFEVIDRKLATWGAMEKIYMRRM